MEAAIGHLSSPNLGFPYLTMQCSKRRARVFSFKFCEIELLELNYFEFRWLLKSPFNQNPIMNNHKPNYDFKSNIILRGTRETQE
jgi:hypothetical protein